MQQNENQHDNEERRKKTLVIIGILVVLAAIIFVIALLADRTDASTDDGEAVLITPDHIEQISDEVSDHVLDTISQDVLADFIRQAITEELTEGTLYELIEDGEIEVAAINKDELRTMILQLLAELEISGDGVLTEDQKKYIRLVIEQVLGDSLSTISVTQLLTDEERKQLEEQLKKELSQMLKNQIENSAFRLTDKELETLKKDPDFQNMISQMVSNITQQQLEQLKADIIAELEKNTNTSSGGSDYLTKDDIKDIQEQVLKKANQETLKQIESLTAKINEVKLSVSTLIKQIKELKVMDKQHSADIKKMQSSITNINTSINHINSVTKQLTDAVDIASAHLEKVTGSGSEIQSSSVSTADMTIAEFVDILAGNDQVYTGAIQELNQIIKQLKEENAKKDDAFDKSLKELEGSLDENGRDLEKTKEELKKSDEEMKKDLQKQTEELKKQLEQESKAREDADKEESRAREDADKEESRAREDADKEIQSQIDDTNELIGDKEDSGKVEGDTIFQKIGSIIRILSIDGIEGLFRALQNVGGAQTLEEGVDHLNTDLLDARVRVGELEKEKWYSDITLLARHQENVEDYGYQENGAAYVYQIPLVTQEDQIDLSADDTSVVVDFKQPDRLPSNVAFSTNENSLLIIFANRPTRNIHITTIHVYKEKR